MPAPCSPPLLVGLPLLPVLSRLSQVLLIISSLLHQRGRHLGSERSKSGLLVGLVRAGVVNRGQAGRRVGRGADWSATSTWELDTWGNMQRVGWINPRAADGHAAVRNQGHGPLLQCLPLAQHLQALQQQDSHFDPSCLSVCGFIVKEACRNRCGGSSCWSNRRWC